MGVVKIYVRACHLFCFQAVYQRKESFVNMTKVPSPSIISEWPLTSID